MKVYKTYKIAKINDIHDEKFTFGMVGQAKNELSKRLVKKINDGILKLGLPYDRLIPYYKETVFTFQNKDILVKFLNEYCQLTKEDYQELKNADYCVWEINTTSIVTGMSNLRSSVWLDEATEPSTILDIEGFYGKPWNEKKCNESAIIDDEDAEYCRISYYGKLKTI